MTTHRTWVFGFSAAALLIGLLCHHALVFAADPQPQGEPRAIDFVRDIQPIFARNCYECHGAQKREGGVRWDRKAHAFVPADSGHVPVTPGNPDHSLLIEMITHPDSAKRMPLHGPALSAEKVELLRRWIEQGADWPEGVDPETEHRHWAFRKPVRGDLPQVKDGAWPGGPIDRFVLARIEDAGLTPSAQADPYTLVRRVYLDLIGLPPSPAEVDAFVQDESPDAYERLVDRLLNDPAYGEARAKMWLDLARYADSSGYGSDQLRPGIWPYRDYVIGAFNRNYSYPRFTIEQLAGDLLPDATQEQILATAFHRNTMTNVEGGTDDEEFRVAAVKDRVDTTMQVWMGLTMNCAQCHSHKFDPITQREYFQFYAIFNQTEDRDLPDESPTYLLRTRELDAQKASIEKQIASVERQIDALGPQLAEAQARWEQSITQRPIEWRILSATQAVAAAGADFKTLEDGSLLVSGDLPMYDTYTVTVETDLDPITAFRLEVLPHESLPAGGPGRGGNGNIVLNEFEVHLGTAQDSAAIAWDGAWASFSQAGFDVAKAIDDDRSGGSGWGIAPQFGQANEAIFYPREPVDGGERKQLTISLVQTYFYHTIGRFRLSATDALNPRIDMPQDVLAALAIPLGERDEAQKKIVAEYFRSISPLSKDLVAQRESLGQQLAQNRQAGTPVPIMKQLPPDRQRTTHTMIGGNFLAPGEAVDPAVPSAFHLLPPSVEPDRLGVAQWLMHEDNPLTARVMVNRLWARLFGVGLVETEEDFGTQGTPPSHPELLDWLAIEFVQRDWDIKAMLRLMVTSSAYRQSSQVTRELLERDSNNRLLARGPRFRLSAEQVRDQAMALSGLLSRKIGGPSVFPPQPDGLWRVAFNADRNWETSTDENRFRRGLYTFWRRTIPYPSMEAFDATSREICAVRRIRTNTPLQAFITLNDPVYVEAAQALARRILREAGPPAIDRARFALKLCTAREADAAQVDELLSLYREALSHYEAHPSDAAALAKPAAPSGMGALNGVSDAELAAWTVIANLLLNLDAVLMKG